jgi:RNA polymerase sigma factor (sigma-70 family)
MTYIDIISLIEKKDRKGWEQLYNLYGRKFYGFAVNNWAFDEDQAWEVVYQTLEAIILKIGSYEIQSQAHFDNLLFKIFINFLRQQYRKLRKSASYELISINELQDTFADESEEPSKGENVSEPFSSDFINEYLNNSESENPKLKLLENALEKLDKQERDLLLLKANGFSYDQIAEMLKIENNQLKVKHYRAKNKLIKLLQA